MHDLQVARDQKSALCCCLFCAREGAGCWDTGHTIDWKNTQVKAVMPYFWQRCTLETWHMRSQPHPLNQEEGILSHVYDALIRPNTLPLHVQRTLYIVTVKMRPNDKMRLGNCATFCTLSCALMDGNLRDLVASLYGI